VYIEAEQWNNFTTNLSSMTVVEVIQVQGVTIEGNNGSSFGNIMEIMLVDSTLLSFIVIVLVGMLLSRE
jgi:hypothetical protein